MNIWVLVKIAGATGAILTLSAVGVIWWRIRGIFHWDRSLRAELKELRRALPNALPADHQGLTLIIDRCSRILSSSSVEMITIRDLGLYIRSIAACYHPDADLPELNITVGAAVKCLEGALDRINLIVARPVFKRLYFVSIRQILTAWRHYRRVTASAPYRFYQNHRTSWRWISRLRLVLLIDPLTLTIYLSRRFTLLSLSRYLLADIYLFVGKMALSGYGAIQPGQPPPLDAALEQTLAALDALDETTDVRQDPLLQQLRNRIAGASTLLGSTPTLTDLKDTIWEAVDHISRIYFPEAEIPWQEAAVGPLLNRGRAWIAGLVKTAQVPFVRTLFTTRLITLYRARSLSVEPWPDRLRMAAGGAAITYRFLKWPLKFYRWSKRRWALPMAVEFGWTLARKASLAYLYGKIFDKAGQELENLYRQSQQTVSDAKTGPTAVESDNSSKAAPSGSIE